MCPIRHTSGQSSFKEDCPTAQKNRSSAVFCRRKLFFSSIESALMSKKSNFPSASTTQVTVSSACPSPVQEMIRVRVLGADFEGDLGRVGGEVGEGG